MAKRPAPAAEKPAPAAKRRAPPADDRATAYARAVAAGKVIAGPSVRGACKRHLEDLKSGVWTWDVAAVERVLGFFADVLTVQIPGNVEPQPFVPLDWQAFILGSLFGWKGPDGFRRFRTAYVETSKGSGKSPLSAGIGLYMLVADREPRAEVYAAAGSRDQAAILFRDAVAMRNASPELAGLLKPSGGPGHEWQLMDIGKASFFRTLASDTPQSGLRVHCALLDEVHEHQDDTTIRHLRAGTKGRQQALIFMITNSGHNRTSVCFMFHEYAIAVAAQLKVDDAFFSYVCDMDTADDPFKSEDCWPKTNPSLGATFTIKYLRELVTEARGMPSQEAIVRRLNFSQWTESTTPWIDNDRWEQAEAEFDVDELIGLPCGLGLDLSRKRDLTALAACWKHPNGDLSLAVWFWTPGDTLDERARTDAVPYRLWLDQGHINAPPGRMIDKRALALFLQEFAGKHTIDALAYDQAQIDDFHVACDDIGLDTWIDDRTRDKNGVPTEPAKEGLRMVRHGQGTQGFASNVVMWMPRSIEQFEKAIIDQRIRVLLNPCLRWNSGSAVLIQDPTGNRKWDKQKSTGRIDGIVAAAMAVGAASAITTMAVSIWDSPEFAALFD